MNFTIFMKIKSLQKYKLKMQWSLILLPIIHWVIAKKASVCTLPSIADDKAAEHCSNSSS